MGMGPGVGAHKRDLSIERRLEIFRMMIGEQEPGVLTFVMDKGAIIFLPGLGGRLFVMADHQFFLVPLLCI